MKKRPLRPKSHVNEDKSRNRSRGVFFERNWIVWDIHHSDYGEDQLVRIVEGDEVTH